MKHNEIFDKAYHNLTELYSNTPDIRVLNRFYSEKMILQRNDYIRYLDLFGGIRARADELGEHIFVRGTTGSSFIAYLLGATDINPLELQEYWDGDDKSEIPFEMNLQSVLDENIQLGVSQHFFYRSQGDDM